MTKSVHTLLVATILLVTAVARASAQVPPRAPAVAGAPAAAPQPAAEPFDLEKERLKAAGTFVETKDGRKRRSPFTSPLRQAAETPLKAELEEEVQRQLVREAELTLGLYNHAKDREEWTSARVHLNRLMKILEQADKFSVPELRERLEQVRSGLDVKAAVADQKFTDVKEAFKAGDYERVAVLYDELTKFVDALPESERAKLAVGLDEVGKIARTAAARLAFSKIPFTITGVVISEPDSYVTINGLVLGVGDLVREQPAEGRPVSPLSMTEPLDPPVKVVEIHLTEVVFEFQNERLSRRAGRRYLIQQRMRRTPDLRRARR